MPFGPVVVPTSFSQLSLQEFTGRLAGLGLCRVVDTSFRGSPFF